MSEGDAMVTVLTWHELYRQLVDQLRGHFPEQLSDDPTAEELRSAIGLLEYVSPPQYFPHPNGVAGGREPVDRLIDRRDVLAWAETDGPLSSCD
jgi:hypothetical protein